RPTPSGHSAVRDQRIDAWGPLIRVSRRIRSVADESSSTDGDSSPLLRACRGLPQKRRTLARGTFLAMCAAKGRAMRTHVPTITCLLLVASCGGAPGPRQRTEEKSHPVVAETPTSEIVVRDYLTVPLVRDASFATALARKGCLATMIGPN